jgi:hypothetical protein
MSTKPYQLTAKNYRWGVCCGGDFDTIDQAKAAVTNPHQASLWEIKEFIWVPGEGPRFVGVVATLCGSIGAQWCDTKAVQ